MTLNEEYKADRSMVEETRGREVEVEELHEAKRRKKDVFRFGNYRGYYGYRVGRNLDEDPRLKVLKKEWFEQKRCLDIGCNIGIITILIAKKFHCRSILGIDIDSDRITDAYYHLRKLMKEEKRGDDGSRFATSEDQKLSDEGDNATTPTTRMTENTSSCGTRELSETVSFRKENFITENKHHSENYDTVLCLSVTKWIQLNWGDNGLITLFTKIWRLLHPGGILILEPQPWKSYLNSRSVSENRGHQRIIKV